MRTEIALLSDCSISDLPVVTVGGGSLWKFAFPVPTELLTDHAMEFDWIDCHFDLKKVTPREIEESFEDPFSIRIFPESVSDDSETRYFSLGKTINNRFLFSVFWTDGKAYRVIASRDMTDDEQTFYDRKNAEWL